MLFSPTLHGFAGAWDEIIFAAAFVISILIFIALALRDRKKDDQKEETDETTPDS
jgi:hypothetical protein